MLKKLSVHLLILLFPYITVAVFWVVTLFAFSFKELITHKMFYSFGVAYWCVLQWIFHIRAYIAMEDDY